MGWEVKSANTWVMKQGNLVRGALHRDCSAGSEDTLR